MSAEEKLRLVEEPSLREEAYRFTGLPREGYRQKAVQKELIQPQAFTSQELVTSLIHSFDRSKFSGSLQARSSSDSEAFDELPGLENDLFCCLARTHATTGFCASSSDQLQHALFVFNQKEKNFFHSSEIVLEAGEELDFIEELKSFGSEQAFFCGLTKVRLKAGARLNFSSFQNLESEVENYSRYYFEVDRDAELNLSFLAKGGKRSQTRVLTRCLGTGSQFNAKAAVNISGRQTVDHWIETEHLCPSSNASVEAWNVVDGSSKAVFNGLIKIAREGQHTDSHQKTRSLLLSDKASAESLPRLIIATDDVQVSHGASMASIDEEQLFYMNSRGLSRKQAEAMIIEGFTEPVIQSVKSNDYQSYLRDAMGRSR